MHHLIALLCWRYSTVVSLFIVLLCLLEPVGLTGQSSACSAGVRIPDTVRTQINCSQEILLEGFDPASIVWRDLNSSNGAFLSYLDCPSGCDEVVISTDEAAERFIHFEVCGILNGADCPLNYQVCDTVIVEVIPTPRTTARVDICDGFAYEWQGRLFTEEGLYTDTLVSSRGCDSLVALDLKVNPSRKGALTATICPGEVFELGGDRFNRPGAYQVTLTDSIKCDSIVTLNLEVLPGPTPRVKGPPILCSGATATLQVPNADQFTRFRWSNGATDPSIAVTTPGDYTVTVSSANGCSAPVSYTLRQAPALDARLTGNNTIDCDNPTATLRAAAYVDGIPEGVNLEWQNSQGRVVSEAPVLETEQAGWYYLKLMDRSGFCTATDSIEVTENPGLPKYSLSRSGVLDCRNSEVTISLNMENDLPNLFVRWTGPNIISGKTDLQVSEAGWYFMEVTNTDNNCTVLDSIRVRQSNQRLVVQLADRAVLRCNPAQVTLKAGVESGTPNYRWRTAAGNIVGNPDTQTVVVNRIGWYFVDVTNERTGCVGTDSILVERPDPIATVEFQIKASCAGDAEGQVEVLRVRGGKTPYRYTLGDTLTANRGVFSGLPVGPHRFEVVDGFGCRWDTLLQVQAASIDSSLQVASICEGTSYIWNGTTYSEEGRYIDTLTAITGCDSIATLDLGFSNNCEAITQQERFCPGTTYEINGQRFREPGTYTVLVESTTGPDSVITLELDYFPVDTPTVMAPPVLCAGDSVELRLDRSFAAYRWSDGSTEPTLMVNRPDKYDITVTDANGCETKASYRVRESVIPVAAISGDSIISCEESFVVLQADPALEGFALRWFNPRGDEIGRQLTQSATEPGLHILSASDTTETCTTTDTFLVKISEEVPVLDFSPPPLLTCQLEEIQLDLNVDRQEVSVEWSGPGIVSGGETLTPAVNRTGLYRAVVTDNATGCMISGAVEVKEDRPLPVVDVEKEVRLDCLTDEARLQASSPDPTVTFEWTTEEGVIAGPVDQAEIVVTEIGWYELTTTDVETGCPTLDRIYVDHPEEPSDVKIRTIPSCGNEESGYIIVDSIINGNPLFAYLLNGMPPPDDQGSYVDLAPGAYQLDIIDGRGCVFPTMVTVDSLPVPETIQEAEICEGEVFEWKGVEYAEAGRYIDTLQAASGCDSLDILDLRLLPAPRRDTAVVICAGTSFEYRDSVLSEPGLYSFPMPAPDGCDSLLQLELSVVTPDSLTIQGPSQLCAGAGATLTASGDFAGFEWNDGSTDSTLEISAGGLYSLIATTAEGCSQTAQWEVLETEAPLALIQGPEAFDCRDSVLLLQAQGLEPGLGWEATWLDADEQVLGAAANLEISTPGSYYLQVTDPVTGCSATDSIEISPPAGSPEIIFSGPFALTCREPEATLEVSLQGEPARLDLRWSGPGIVSGQNSLSVRVNEPGVYQIEVVNPADGCRTTESIDVEDDRQPPLIILPPSTDLDCLTGSATLSAQGTPDDNWRYRWTTSDGQLSGDPTLATVEVAASGTYQLEVNDDSNGCSTVETVTVTAGNGPNAFELTIEPTCADTSGGLLIVNRVIGGAPPYLFALDEGTLSGESGFRDLPGGEYRLQVEDADGCSLDTTVTIAVQPAIEITLPAELNIRIGDSIVLDPQINVPEEGLAQVNWSPAAGLSCADCLRPTASPETFRNYRLEVVDEYGCSGKAAMSVFVDTSTPVYIPSAFSPNGDGVNDYFTIFSYDSVQRIKELLVFDRWGASVYRQEDLVPNDPSTGWDGKINGQEAAAGIFVYYAVVEFFNGEEVILKGDVMLMR